jgi:hypothetical protein
VIAAVIVEGTVALVGDVDSVVTVVAVVVLAVTVAIVVVVEVNNLVLRGKLT